MNGPFSIKSIVAVDCVGECALLLAGNWRVRPLLSVPWLNRVKFDRRCSGCWWLAAGAWLLVLGGCCCCLCPSVFVCFRVTCETGE